MLNTTELALCPLCRRDNACGNITGIATCWCNTKGINFSPALLDKVPEQKKRLSCICEQCARKFQPD